MTMNHFLSKHVFVCLLLSLTGVLPAASPLPVGTTGAGLSEVRIDRWPRYDLPVCIAPGEVRRKMVGGRAMLFPATSLRGLPDIDCAV